MKKRNPEPEHRQPERRERKRRDDKRREHEPHEHDREREERTRQRILDYAQRVFNERGFRRITVDELCAGMALSKRTFYKYFRHRDELVGAVVEGFAAHVIRRIVPNLLSDRPVREVLEDHFRLLYEDLLSAVSLPFLSDVQTLTPDLWRKIEERRVMVVGLVVTLVERGQKEGVIRSDLNAAVFGKVFQRIVMTVAEPGFLLTANLTPQDTFNIVRAMLTRGIIEPEQAKEADHGR
jgi:AcrR family transcriptional regulator